MSSLQQEQEDSAEDESFEVQSLSSSGDEEDLQDEEEEDASVMCDMSYCLESKQRGVAAQRLRHAASERLESSSTKSNRWRCCLASQLTPKCFVTLFDSAGELPQQPSSTPAQQGTTGRGSAVREVGRLGRVAAGVFSKECRAPRYATKQL